MKKSRKPQRCEACRKAARKVISKRKYLAICHSFAAKDEATRAEHWRYMLLRDKGLFICTSCALLWHQLGDRSRQPTVEDLRALQKLHGKEVHP